MTTRPLTMNSNYLAAVRGLREFHHLTAAGRLDSPEADAVRDATDAPWEALTDEEKERISGLSEDLYSITDRSRTVTKPLNPQAQSRLIDLYQAHQTGDWTQVLVLSRRWGAYLEPSLLSFFRGTAWYFAGDLATALIFYRYASGLQPNNETYSSAYLAVLEEVATLETR